MVPAAPPAFPFLLPSQIPTGLTPPSHRLAPAVPRNPARSRSWVRRGGRRVIAAANSSLAAVSPVEVLGGLVEGGRGAPGVGLEMNYGSSSIASGATTSARSLEFGRTHVVRPKGRHLATVVWLHGLGDNGSSWSQLLETLPLPDIKWICPTAPTRPVAIFGGFPSASWFDVNDLSENGPDDVEGMDAAAMHVANLLSTEPAGVKVGIGGFSMGAATALYSATSCAHGKFGNGKLYPVNLSAVVALSGWLPCARSLKNKLEGDQDAARRASSLPILLCHGKGDDVVLYQHGEKSAQALKSAGFENVTFNTYSGLGHYTVPAEMDSVCKFLTASLGLDGSHS